MSLKFGSPSSTRRSFLRQGTASCAAAVAACAHFDVARWASSAPIEFPSPGIETAIATICCDGFGDENFKYAFEAIPNLNIQNVEFNCWYPRNLTQDGLASIRERCRVAGLKPISIQARAFKGGEGASVSKEVKRQLGLIEACETLGCSLIKCTGSKRGTNGGIKSLISVLKEAAPVAEQHGVKIVLENHYDNVIELPEDYEAVFSAIDSPSIGMCLDMGHFAASNVDMQTLIDRFHPKVFHIDVKDCERVGKPKFVRFGTGIVDVNGIIQHCVARGFCGYLVIELSLIDRKTMLNDLRAGHEITKPFET